MNAVLGTAAVALALAGSVLGVITLAMGLKRGDARFLRSGQRYVWVVLGGAVLATVAMQSALLGHDFSLAYVARNGSRETPLLYTITGMWSALEGSILLWGLVLAGYLAVMARHFRSRASDPLVAWATLTGLVVAAFFFLLLAGPANPFKVGAGPTPFDGMGPNPLLQNHPLVAFHPPMLYLGYVGFTVPFAFAIAALATGRLGEGWLVETRRWTLFAWGFLTVGVVLGVWWSYEVLGWGGYWAWDPVENASFLPWLTATAYLHSVMVQERRGMLRVWNLSLLVATFSLTILGTFLTRSGVLDSVHAFSESAIGPMILAFFAVVVAVSVGLVAWRADRLRSPGTIDSPVSREGAFLANNVAFGAFAFVVLLGTVFPLIAEALRGDRLSVGAPYFERMTMPIGFTLLFLMAVAPALPWRRASTEVLHRRLLWPAWAGTLTVVACVAFGIRGFGPLVAFGLAAFAGAAAVRQLVLSVGAARESGAPLWRGLTGRSNGGMIVHLGVVLIAVGFAASSSFGHRHQFRLAPGESASLAGHTVTYLGFDVIDQPNKRTFRARVRIDGGQVYAPALHQFPGASLAIGSPSVRSGPIDDVYLTLVAPPDASSADPTAVIGVNIQPLVAWLWMGGAVMGFGTLLAAWPRDRRRRPPSGADPEPPSAAVPPEPDADDAIVPAALAEPAVAAEAPVVEPVGQPVPTVVLGQPVPTAGPVGQPVPTVVPVGQPVPTPGPVGQPVPTVVLGQPVPPAGPLGQPVPTVVLGQPVPTPGPVGQPVPTVVLGQPVPTPGPVGQPVPTVVLGQPVPTPGPVGQPVPTVVLGQPVPTPGPVGQPVPTVVLGQPVPTLVLGQPVPTVVLGQPVPTVVPVGQPVPTVGPAALAEPTVVPVGQPVPTVVPVGQPVPTAGPAALAEPAVAAEVPG